MAKFLVRRLSSVTVGLLLVLFGAWGHAQLASTPPPFRTFAYRGYLERAGVAVNGPVDLEVRMFDAESSDVELTAEPMRISDVSVQAGWFSTQITLPGVSIDRAEVWLALAVDRGDGVVPLSGRQRLTSLPYAQIAQQAGSAKHAGSADVATLSEHAAAAARTDQTFECQHWEASVSNAGGGYREAVAGMPSVPAGVAAWQRTGGGCHCGSNNPGRLMVLSEPEGSSEWRCGCKDHVAGDGNGSTTASVWGCRLR